MSQHFADRLLAGISEKKAPVCVGFDPVVDRLPPAIRESYGLNQDLNGLLADESTWENVGEAFFEFGRGVIGAVSEQVPSIKINIAFFEPFHESGLRAYDRLIKEAISAGLIVIGDVKRADIGHTTTQYALAHLGTPNQPANLPTPHAVTVNPYFGIDGIKPFIDIARERNRGLFALVQTSNESANEVQGLTLSDGTLVCQQVARLVESWANDSSLIGLSGYSCIGAVVSPRDLESTKLIRNIMPSCLFLVPGFGAQGRTADEVAECFKPDGTGAIVNASRSVIYAFDNDRYRKSDDVQWQDCVHRACTDLIESLRRVVTI